MLENIDQFSLGRYHTNYLTALVEEASPFGCDQVSCLFIKIPDSEKPFKVGGDKGVGFLFLDPTIRLQGGLDICEPLSQSDRLSESHPEDIKSRVSSLPGVSNTHSNDDSSVEQLHKSGIARQRRSGKTYLSQCLPHIGRDATHIRRWSNTIGYGLAGFRMTPTSDVPDCDSRESPDR